MGREFGPDGLDLGLVHLERVIDLVRKGEIPEMGDTERLEAMPKPGYKGGKIPENWRPG